MHHLLIALLIPLSMGKVYALGLASDKVTCSGRTGCQTETATWTIVVFIVLLFVVYPILVKQVIEPWRQRRREEAAKRQAGRFAPSTKPEDS